MLLCPKCKNTLEGFYPKTCGCGYTVPQIASVYQFCDDPPISLDQEGHRYLGYEKVGENYDGPSTPSTISDDEYGIFGSCSRKLAELLSPGSVALDLGAGLGPASITLAMAGVDTIAADISQTMLSIAAKRALGRQFTGRLVFARMNAYELPIADNSLDAVVAIDVLHQLDNPEVAIKEILRVLKPDGVLAEYGSKGLAITQEQREINNKCTDALNDIQNHYRKSLVKHGYTGLPFSSWDKVKNCIENHFELPDIMETQSDMIWTGKMAKGIHKLFTRAAGSAQLIPDDIHYAAWEETHAYAVGKYGEDYRNMPGYSRFTGLLKVYRKRKGAVSTGDANNGLAG